MSLKDYVNLWMEASHRKYQLNICRDYWPSKRDLISHVIKESCSFMGGTFSLYVTTLPSGWS